MSPSPAHWSLNMMKAFARSRFARTLRMLHRDERGMEAMQIVMILAIAALALIFAKQYGGKAIDWARTKLDELMSG